MGRRRRKREKMRRKRKRRTAQVKDVDCRCFLGSSALSQAEQDPVALSKVCSSEIKWEAVVNSGQLCDSLKEEAS